MCVERSLWEVTAKDLSLLSRLHAETFPDDPWSSDWFRDVLSPPPVQAFLMAVTAKPAGFAVISVVGGEAEIMTIGIVPPFQRQGHGAALLEKIEDQVRAGGATRMFLEVRAGNDAAIRLYRAAGYKEVGKRPGYYRGGEDALVLAREFT